MRPRANAAGPRAATEPPAPRCTAGPRPGRPAGRAGAPAPRGAASPAPAFAFTADFDYELPKGRVARYPAAERSGSRLLAADRSTGRVRHLRFRDLPELMAPGDLLVLNDTRVLPARLAGRKPSGAAAEILLLRPAPGWDERHWEALVRPGAKLKPGRVVRVSPELSVFVAGPGPDGGRTVRLDTSLPVSEALDRFGRVPLPPYLGRSDEPLDRERYQTVYASRDGSVAAPTAGLHFTRPLLAEIEARGVALHTVTLHVGPGTFRPVGDGGADEHEMHAEPYWIPEAAARAHARCRRRGGRVWAVGTTVVRALETAFRASGRVRAGAGSTDLFIRPPYRFGAVDCLITNFHLPRSTLLMLTAAFAGRALAETAYAAAVREGYRFYSYGDAMAALP